MSKQGKVAATVEHLASIGVPEGEIIQIARLKTPLSRRIGEALRRGQAAYLVAGYTAAFDALNEGRTAVVLAFLRLRPEWKAEDDPEAVKAR